MKTWQRYLISVLLSTMLLAGLGMLVAEFIRIAFSHRSKPDIELVNPRPACKICHCGKTSCHRECGEENMCTLRCEGLCERKLKDDAVDDLNHSISVF